MATTPYCFPYPSAATYPPHFSGGYYPPPFSSYPATASGFFPAPAYDAPPTFPCAATECTTATGFPYAATYPHPPYLWSPPPTPCSPLFPFGSSPDPAYGNGFIATQTSQTVYGPNQPPPAPTLESSIDSPLKPLPVPTSSEFSGDLSSRSPLCSRPMLQQQKEEGGQTEDGATPRYDCTFRGKAIHFAMPKFRCLDGDLAKGTNTSGASINDEKLVHTQSGPEILSMANNDSNNSFVTPQGQFQSSFDSLRRELSKLSTLVSQFAVEMGVQTTKASVTGSCFAVASAQFTSPASLFSNTSVAPSSSTSYLSSTFGPSFVVPTPTLTSVSVTSASTLPSATANVAPQMFGEMPTQSSSQGTHGSAPDYRSGHQFPIQCTCVPDGNNNLSEQNLDGMPQAYGLHNFNRQSVCLADGTEHSYFTLPADYPLERVVPEPVFDVYDDETEGCSSKSVDVFADTPGQQIYEEEPQRGEPLLKCLSKALETEHTSACVNIISDVRDFTFELQQQDEERVYSSPVIKDSNSSTTSSSQLNIEHGMRELRLLWDPGATDLPIRFTTGAGATDQQGIDVYRSARQHIPADTHDKEQMTQEIGLTSTYFSKAAEIGQTSACLSYNSEILDCTLEQQHQVNEKASVNARQLRAPPWNVLVIDETRTEWHPGDHTIRLLFYSQGYVVAKRETVQWDPGIGTHSSMYFWLPGLTARIVTRKPLSWLQNSELATWQSLMTSASSVWDPGVHIYLYSWLNILLVWAAADKQLSCTHISDLASWQNQLVCNAASSIWDPGIDSLMLSNNRTSTISHGITSYAYTMKFINDQLELVHQQGVQKNYNAKSLISSQNYLQLSEWDIIFTTFLPP